MVQKVLDILVEKKLINKQNIAELQDHANQAGISLQDYLLENNIVTTKDIARAYSKAFSVTYIATITEHMADPNLLGKIQFSFLRHHILMPILYKDKTALVVENPLALSMIDQVAGMLGVAQPVVLVSTPQIILDAINRYYPLEGTKQMIDDLEESDQSQASLDVSQIDEQDILTMASQAPIVKLVNHILFQAVKRGASDIHFEPYEKELRVRYRVDGVMFQAFTPPHRVQGALVSRIKIMANLNIAEKRLPQDGRIEIKIAGKPIDIRVSVLPVSYGERVVLRLLDKSRTMLGIEQLGLSERDHKVMLDIVSQPNGIILVSGPTGSGKTTTLYSVLGRVNKPDVNVITVEDPVEYQISGLNQVQVNEKVGLTFAAALRSILRQDPDIVMIGETRDVETAQISVQAALTGHLVLSTIHTNSAPATITRLIDMGIEPFLIASSLLAVVAQRLVRRLCPDCKKKYTPEPDLLESVGITPQQAKNITFYKPVGCSECLESGFKGRMPIFEIMRMSPDLANLVMQGVDARQLQKQARKEGMSLLIQDGIRKIEQGLTTISELLSVATNYE